MENSAFRAPKVRAVRLPFISDEALSQSDESLRHNPLLAAFFDPAQYQGGNISVDPWS